MMMMRWQNIFFLFFLIFLQTCLSAVSPAPPDSTKIVVERAQNQDGSASQSSVQEKAGQNIFTTLTNNAGNLLKGVQHFVVGVLSGINDVGLLGQGIEPISTSTVEPDETTETTTNDEDEEKMTQKLIPDWSIPISATIPTTVHTPPPPAYQAQAQAQEHEAEQPLLENIHKILFRTSTPWPPPPPPQPQPQPQSQPPFFEETGTKTGSKNPPSLPAEAYLPLIHSQYPQYQLVAVPWPPKNDEKNKIYSTLSSASTSLPKIQQNNPSWPKFGQQQQPYQQHANEQPVIKLVETKLNGFESPEGGQNHNYFNAQTKIEDEQKPTFVTNQPPPPPLLDYTQKPPRYTIRRKFVTTPLPPKPEKVDGAFNFEITLGPVVRPPGYRPQPPKGGYEFKPPPPVREIDQGFYHGQGFAGGVRKPPPSLELVPGGGPPPFGPGQVEETEGPEEIVQVTTTEGGEEGHGTEESEIGEADIVDGGRRLVKKF